jgi:hypothetical protein
LDRILAFFEKEFTAYMNEHFPTCKWKGYWSSQNTQIIISGYAELFLKKETGKGDMYRFQTRTGFAVKECKELFSTLIEKLKENHFDCIVEFRDKLVATGEKSLKTLSIFNKLKSLSNKIIENNCSAFSFSSLPFVQYKYNVKLYPEDTTVQIANSFKDADWKNHSKKEVDLRSSEDILLFLKNFDDNCVFVDQKINELRNFVQRIDPRGNVVIDYRYNVMFFKKCYFYMISKHDDFDGFYIIVKRRHEVLDSFSAETLEDVFEEIKNHIDHLSKSDRLEAIMESRI